jgi:transposase
MTLRPQVLPPVPEATVAAVQAAFPKGNLHVALRLEFGSLYDDQLFADLYPPAGRPVEVAPWRLALVMVMPYLEGLTDRQAADAVRRCMDWQYALSLDLHDPGFDFTLLHDFRCRVLAHEAAQRLLDTFLSTCKARGWLKARGTQRTDSTQVLAAIRTLHRLACVLEAMHYALNQLSDVAPAWVRQQVPPVWYTRYGLRSDQARLPKDASKLEALARQVGADGYQLLAWVQTDDTPVGLKELSALEVLRRIWVQQYYRCTVSGLETLRWRTGDEQPPSAVRVASPSDLEARSSSKRETHWVGSTRHLTETCDADSPNLITQVMTTPATTQDSMMGPPIQQD